MPPRQMDLRSKPIINKMSAVAEAQAEFDQHMERGTLTMAGVRKYIHALEQMEMVAVDLRDTLHHIHIGSHYGIATSERRFVVTK